MSGPVRRRQRSKGTAGERAGLRESGSPPWASAKQLLQGQRRRASGSSAGILSAASGCCLPRTWVGASWVGATEEVDDLSSPSYDPHCALCPGNERLSGGRNPDYDGVFWFTNDLPCFSTDAASTSSPDDPLYPARPVAGTAEVVCYHPDHGLTMADLGVEEIRAIVELWADRYEQLGARADVECMHIFENKGQLVGTSNPHPHCQIYAGSLVYATIAREAQVASRYFREKRETIGLAVADREMAGARVVGENERSWPVFPGSRSSLTRC